MKKAQKKPQEMPFLHKLVFDSIPKGRNNSIPISFLAERLGLTSKRRQINSIINDLIFKYNKPVGTSSDDETKGIFIIQDHADLKLAARTLNSRMNSLMERHKKLLDNYNNLKQEA